jgi:hypothetical protein
MYVFITFPYSFDVELALSELKKYGYKHENMMVIPMQPFHRSESMTDMMSEESSRMFDWSLLLGSVFMLLGVIYGYVLRLGPVIWGLIGLVGGGLIGLGIQAIINKKKKKKWSLTTVRQVLLMVHAEKSEQIHRIESIMKAYNPTSYATIDMQSKRDQYLKG